MSHYLTESLYVRWGSDRFPCFSRTRRLAHSDGKTGDGQSWHRRVTATEEETIKRISLLKVTRRPDPLSVSCCRASRSWTTASWWECTTWSRPAASGAARWPSWGRRPGPRTSGGPWGRSPCTTPPSSPSKGMPGARRPRTPRTSKGFWLVCFKMDDVI